MKKGTCRWVSFIDRYPSDSYLNENWNTLTIAYHENDETHGWMTIGNFSEFDECGMAVSLGVSHWLEIEPPEVPAKESKAIAEQLRNG